MPTGSVSAVALDLDGVLVDSEAVNLGSAFEAFAAAGCPIDDRHSTRIVGRHPDDYVPEIVEEAGLGFEVVERVRGLQDGTYRRLWDERARLVSGARELLDALRARGLPVALATSAGREHASHCLRRFGLESYFRLVLTGDDVSERKPSPEIYVAAARLLGVEPPGLLVVEDSEHGVEAAAAAGSFCVALRTPQTPAGALTRADVVVDGLHEVIPLVDAGRPA